MKQIILISALVLVLATIMLFAFPVKTHSDEEKEPPLPTLSSAQMIWLAKLMQCESSINKDAINPKDLDNTPSLGLLQFKQSTYDQYMKKYGLHGTIMDGTSQVSIVTHWIAENNVDWHIQFPVCVSRYGVPPLGGISH